MRDIYATYVRDKIAYILIFLGVCVAVFYTPLRLTDQFSELSIIGNAWFGGGSIPLVQAYTSTGPLPVFLASVMDFLIGNEFYLRLFDIAFYVAVGVILRAVLGRHAYSKTHRNLLLICSLLVLWLPGSQELGVTTHKVGLLFVALTYFCYQRWVSSGKSFWFFGETSKNWRWLVACGISLSMVAFTSVVYVFLCLPVVIGFITSQRTKKKDLLTWSSLLIVPILLQAWLWISYFSSRDLLGDAVRAQQLDIRILLQNPLLSSEPRFYVVSLLFSALIVGICVFGARGSRLRESGAAPWISSVALLGFMIFAGLSSVAFLPALLIVVGYLYKIQGEKLWKYAPSGILLIFLVCIPYKLALQTKIDLEYTQSREVFSYLETDGVTSDDTVLYIGRGAGFYSESGLVGSTRFYEMTVQEFDTPELQLLSKLRGDNEGNRALYAVVALDPPLAINRSSELQDYISRHYEKATELGGYAVYKRKLQS